MNELFKGGEGVVNTLYSNVVSTFDVEDFYSNSNYLNEYIEYLDPIVKESVFGFHGGTGLFLTFDPALKDYTKPYEIWYAYDKNGDLKFIDASANGVYLEAFKEPDAPYMQFFFKSIKDKEYGIWTELHYDPDIKKDVFGYCRSVYLDDLLIGVIGTTISSSDLYRTAQKMDIENNGYILLLSEKDNLMQAFTKEKNNYKKTTNVPSSLLNAPRSDHSGSEFASIDGDEMLITYSKLSNGWTFVIANHTEDIFDTVYTSQTLFTLISILLSLIIVCFSYLVMRSYTSPTEKAVTLLKTLDLDDDIKYDNEEQINNEDIELFIKNHVEKQREKDIYIAQISRQAELGEMLETVMHQWKQPLNRINLIMGNLRDTVDSGAYTSNDIIKSADKTEDTVINMVEVLDDFREYINPGKEVAPFKINDVIEASLTLLNYSIKNSDIKIAWVKDENLSPVKGHKNVLYHVLLNILTNGIEAIISSDDTKRIIEINVTQNEQEFLISIFNTGNQLSQNEQDNLFKPYFTTKSESGGSGMGLLISKNLLENLMNGTISLENRPEGVECLITIIDKGEEDA